MRRVLRPRGADDDRLDLASNDYLGLARDPRVTGAAAAAAAAWGAGVDRVAAGHRLAPTCTPSSRRRWPTFVGARGRAGVLLRLPRQPRRGHRAGRRRHPGGLRRAEPRLPRGRLPAGRGRRVRSLRTATSTPSTALLGDAHRGAGGRRHRRRVLRRRRPRAAGRAARRRPRATGHCSSWTRRTASASWAPDGRGGCACGGHRRRARRRADPDAEQVARLAGRRGARRRRRGGAPRQHGPGLHLRHRAGSGRGRRRAGRARGAARRAGAGRPPYGSGPWSSLPALGAGRPARDRRRRGRWCRCSSATRGGRSRLPVCCATPGCGSAASGRRRCPTGCPGCGSPRAPTSPTPTVDRAVAAVPLLARSAALRSRLVAVSRGAGCGSCAGRPTASRGRSCRG